MESKTSRFNHTGDNAHEASDNEVLARAAEIRKTAQLPNATASTHEIHGDIGLGQSR